MADQQEDHGNVMKRVRVVAQVLLAFGVALMPSWFYERSMGIVFGFLLAGEGISLLRR